MPVLVVARVVDRRQRPRCVVIISVADALGPRRPVSVVAVRRSPVPHAAITVRKRLSITPVRIIAVVAIAPVRVAVVMVVIAAAIAPFDIFAFDIATLVSIASWSSPA